MLKVQSIADALNRWAPSKLAEEWDNVGVLVGDPSAEVKKVLVCLDVGLPAIEHAVESGAQMIVAHHPMIFRPIKNVRLNLPIGRRLRLLLKNDIAVFAAHTNLDAAPGGVNDVLAEKIGLVDVKPLDRESIEPSLRKKCRRPILPLTSSACSARIMFDWSTRESAQLKKLASAVVPVPTSF